MAYLDDHPNRNLNQQRARRDQPSGVIVVHTAESALDEIGEDTGAEGVARYIGVRTSYGSYHRLADSDSVVAVARFEMTTYGDGTGSNDHAIHISFACRASDWPGMSAERKAAFIANGAKAAREARDWLKREHGIDVPARRISRAQSDAKVPGFISHGERDPGRRTDPGREFPWDQFLNAYAANDQEDVMNKDQERKLDEVLDTVRILERMNRRKLERVNARLARANTYLREQQVDLDAVRAEIAAALAEGEDGDASPRP